MKELKRVFSIMAIVAVIMSTSISGVVAKTTEKTITSDAYHIAMEELHAKYGVEYVVIEQGYKSTISEALFDEALKYYENRLQDMKKANETVYVINADEEEFEKLKAERTASVFALMPYPYSKSTYANIKNGVGSCRIKSTFECTVNGNTGTYMHSGRLSSKRYGKAVNFSSWSETDNRWSIGGGGTYCNGYIKGDFLSSYVDPFVGATVSELSEHTVNSVFFF